MLKSLPSQLKKPVSLDVNVDYEKHGKEYSVLTCLDVFCKTLYDICSGNIMAPFYKHFVLWGDSLVLLYWKETCVSHKEKKNNNGTWNNAQDAALVLTMITKTGIANHIIVTANAKTIMPWHMAIQGLALIILKTQSITKALIFMMISHGDGNATVRLYLSPFRKRFLFSLQTKLSSNFCA